MSDSSPRLGIIADDLTGAMDTGVQFAKEGLHTVVMLGEGELPEAEMVVASTDSRDLPAAEAFRRAREAGLRLAGRTIYKKLDSTLRGNLGPEIDGLLDALALERALVAPAYPSAGRTTVGGLHMVHGVPLAESNFASDPTWPATESHLPTILSKQTRRAVGHLDLSVVRQGVGAVAATLRAEPAPIVAADAETPEDLRTLAMALARMEEGWLPCGSAGLAEEWPRALGLERPRTELRWTEDSHAVLVLSGSRNRASAEQLRRADAEGYVRLVNLTLCHREFGTPCHPERSEASLRSERSFAVDQDDTCRAPGDGVPGNEDAEIAADVAALLNQGTNVALTTTFSEYHEGKAMAVAARLAEIAGLALARARVAGLFLTGGDVARAVCRRLGATALQALGEVQPGVPAGLLVGGPYGGTRVVTKAGGFGNDKAIMESIDCLRGKTT